ncbi:MAG: T9SS C-terminal target domain-containing protein [Calditrichaeota bacterium]|nr:MAG: T9SS C-terminal target domain-containing protein [Calditrichota bacterium]MBL1205286.1 T9SS C-terminal target domain-containing protein [Calditrichota bacterium]NOG45115.1 T9SS type A sorting domain-containing protein [Calditrichota bacterium]
MLKFLLSLSLIFIFSINLFSQELQFERKINPFPVKDKNGFVFKQPFIGGFNVPRIQFIDIDHDNDKDLFVQEIDDRITFFENIASAQNPEFTWQTDDWLMKNHGAWYRFVDIDNDGDIDLFSQGEQEQVSYYQNQNGILTLKADTLRDSAGDLIISELTSIPNFFDIDCDGDKDLFLGRQTGTITFYENIANPPDQIPQFKFATDSYQDILIIGGGLSKNTKHHGANSLSFGDLNNDGPAELLYGDFFSRGLYYFENDGRCDSTSLRQASDEYPDTGPVETGGFNVPELVDIDNDNDLDLFVTVHGGFFSFTQNVVENFLFYENFGSEEQAEFVFNTGTFINQFDAGEQSVPTFVDIDADGDLDLFVGNNTQPVASATHGQLLFFKNIGDSLNPQFLWIEGDYVVVENMFNYAPAFADLDADGDFDLFIGRINGKLAYFLNTGTAQNAKFELVSSRYADIDVGATSVPAFADLDNDQDFDLVIGESDGNLNFYKNNGDKNSPDFSLESNSFAGINVGSFAKPSFYDFDNDGDSDLLIGNSDGKIFFYKNNSTQSEILFNEIEETLLTAQKIAAPAMANLYGGFTSIVSGTQGGGLYYFDSQKANPIEKEPALNHPNSFNISQNYPNPFNGQTHFDIELAKPGYINISIFDISGGLVKTILSDHKTAGKYSFMWDSSTENNDIAASGLYYLRVNFDFSSHSRKLILLK